MAVVNEADDVFVFPQHAAQIGGKRVIETVRVISIAAADDDTSKYFMAEVPGTAVLERVELEGPAISGASDYDIGFYDTDGNVIIKDKLADGLDLSSITGLPTGPTGDAVRQGMTNLALADAVKSVAELAGHVVKALPATGETRAKEKYRIVLTANTVGTAAGTLIARVRYLMEP